MKPRIVFFLLLAFWTEDAFVSADEAKVPTRASQEMDSPDKSSPFPSESRIPIQKTQTRPMSLENGRLYALTLVNADRAKYQLSPLTMDSIASVSGQKHSDEMAKFGYCAHWDISGKKPWQRYTEAGGTHNVSENVVSWEVPSNRMVSAAQLEKLESFFMDEKPPNDGHRNQILTATHNRLGIGLSYSPSAKGAMRLCLSQEFVDKYGEYSKIANTIVRGIPFNVSGYVFPGVQFDSVLVLWEPAPKPLSMARLAEMVGCSYGDYQMASLSQLDKPAVKVWTQNGRQCFSVQITADKNWRSGLYYVVIQARLVKTKDLIIISTRTTHLY